MAYAAVISLQRTIQNLKTSPRIILSLPSTQMLEFAYQKLKTLQEILKRLDKSSKGDCRKKVNAVDARIKEVVWKFEDLVESHVSNQILSRSLVSEEDKGCDINLQEIRSDVDDFTKLLNKMEEEYMYELDHPTPEEELDVAVSSTTNKSKVVGSSNILSEIKDRLRPDTNFSVIRVVGMAGIGKTTISKEIFDDSLTYNESDIPFEFGFQCRAWVTVGRKYRLYELERDILVQLDSNMENRLMNGDKNDYSHYLKQILNAKRCLVVLEDVWNTNVFDQLITSLPGERSRSRILLTTRLQYVAEYARRHWPPEVYAMQLLNKDESWDLLRERVFGEDVCSTELEKHGKKIADKCDGLPLTIVTVANLLSQAEKTAEYWKHVAENRKSWIFMAAYDITSEVLFPSYEYLPQRLKPCFLHMGVFPPNYEISKLSLVRMWIAEGFLEPNEEQILDDSAKMYLGELVDNNVVLICQESTNFDLIIADDVKTCRLQSAFWHLCCREATKSKFFHVLTSLGDGLEESMKNQRRLSFHNNILFGINDVHDLLQHCASAARSLLCFGPFYPYEVPICFSLRLLRVLDALQIRFYEFPMQVLQLVHLRYLALTYNGELPASISKLWNLQVLIIYRYISITKLCEAPSYVPIEIWDMRELKHIQIMGTNLPNTSSDTSLDNLLTLIGVSSQTCTQEVLERIPNLRKLGIEIQLLPDDDMEVLHCLNHIDVLSKLSSLKCVVTNPELRPEIVTLPAPLSMFPSSLEKLHLSGLGYPWEYMSIIGSLPNLDVLKLRYYAFQGPRWEVKDGEFVRLTHLLIEGTDLVQFKVQFGAFPGLRWLCLKHCYELEDIEWEYYYPYKVEMIDCSPSTLTFANEIRGKSYNRTQVVVHSSWEDGEAEA